jgi:hypothetical protein
MCTLSDAYKVSFGMKINNRKFEFYNGREDLEIFPKYKFFTVSSEQKRNYNLQLLRQQFAF